MAAQLHSHTTATALRRYKPGNDEKLNENVADFLELVNNWFDIMNSYTPSASVITKQPYGKHFERQNELLDTIKTTFLTMRAITKNALQIFQKGAIISITSLQNLYKDLKEQYGISYILTHRLNQDCLENLFCQVTNIHFHYFLWLLFQFGDYLNNYLRVRISLHY